MYSPCGQSCKYTEPMAIMQIGMTIVTPRTMLQPTGKRKPEPSNLMLATTDNSCNINI